jgi:pantetheine-phosphate adenylyltransferase
MARALYSGSFDPVTLGHLDIIQRASRVFDDLEVVVGNNPAKRYVFTLEERVRFIRHALPDGRVRVHAMEGQLLADYAYEAGIPTVVKGVRGIQDYDYERMMHEVNMTQQRGIDTHVLLARRELAHVSSSAVKELCRFQGFTHTYVPPWVKEALERRLNDQVIVGLTGGIACGKSHVGRALVEAGAARGITVHDIDLDHVGHDLLAGRDEPAYRQLRAEVAASFGLPSLDRRALGALVFNDAVKLARLNEMMRTPLLTRLRAGMAGKRGVILINAALLAEADLLHLCNNNVIVVTAPQETRVQRLRARGLNDEQLERRLAAQFSTQEKLARVRGRITEQRWGRCHVVESTGPLGVAMLTSLLESFTSEAWPG